MFRASSKFIGHRALAIGAVLTIPALAATMAFAQSKGPTDEVTITVNRYRTLDKIDVGGTPPDIFARVTIGGHKQQTPVAKQQISGRPNWKITHAVPRGKTNVKVELLDKDVLNPSDVIDINRVDKKRDLDFVVDTSNCRVEGFVGISRCGQKISRTGQEKKKSEIDFTVSVKKGK
jgi:hypothetical protein